MHTTLKTILAAILTTMIVAVSAQPRQSAAHELSEKIGEEAYAELIAEKTEITKETLGKRMFQKFHADMDAVRAAFITDCITDSGEDKTENCTCAVGKMGIKAIIALMEKQMLSSQTQMDGEEKRLAAEKLQAEIACGLKDKTAKQ